MIRHIKASVFVLVFSTVFFGIIYPLAIWVVGCLFFPEASQVQRVTVHGCTVGLYHVGQNFSSPAYFWSRPSVISKEYAPLLVSTASNLSWSSPALRVAVEERVRRLKGPVQDPLFSVPSDLIMASASGIDPEISLKAALFQVPRVAAARGVSEDELRALVVHEEENCLFGLFPHRVNVLKLNCALDHHYPFVSQE